MSEHAAEHAQTGTTRLFVFVWIWLAVITGVEVFLGYKHIQPAALMLTLLMALSLIKAGLIMAYFMHLRFEKRGLVLLLIPALVFCICMMIVFFPDSLRLLELRPK